jgi:hypothetical protein
MLWVPSTAPARFSVAARRETGVRVIGVRGEFDPLTTRGLAADFARRYARIGTRSGSGSGCSAGSTGAGSGCATAGCW